MKFKLETSDRPVISHYGPGVIGVSGTDYRSNLLLTDQGVLENWFEGSLEALSLDHFAPLLAQPPETRPEIVVFGSGSTHRFPPLALIAELAARGIALEVMSTHAACRTYSVLLGEDRRVAAALLQMD